MRGSATAKTKSRKCEYCKESFQASSGRQIYCKRSGCARERKYEYWMKYIKQWKESHPNYWENYLRKWRRENPEYHREWRRKLPNYFRDWYKKRKAEALRKAK